ncbi:MAG: hypothetical protein WKG07_05845 [Hymenobacter sp.]
MLPLGGAVTLSFLAPVITAVAAIWLVGEPLKPWQFVFYALAVAGVALAKGTEGLLSAGVLLGVGSAVSSGLSSVFLRRVGDKVEPLVPVFYFNLVPLIIATGWLFFDFKWPLGHGVGVAGAGGRLHARGAVGRHAGFSGRTRPATWQPSITWACSTVSRWATSFLTRK